ncbi:hypothetical protein RFM23_24180 [Mesorhizobium abyssinicae]|uniref:SnoaL-like domain-containing protein n=1 Tax=Mesorhizobium abyssinicae TaxID=1209958 RepID=A0ABU5ATS5_9HYPH|nr:hypothetical protein [Mesorhizobium abyssinicae]MDX8540720.1 hypothetical protein [Mesorhizobium abyssinicae]
MDQRASTKTFGMREPTDLYEKLLHDIGRLRSARSSAESRYAAFDCAVDAWHLVDWTLHVASDASYERLSGFKRGGPSKKGKLTVEAGFKDLQEDRLPALRFCHMIANSVKHREVRNDFMPNLWSGSTAILSWSEPEKETGECSVKEVSLLTYVTVDGERYEAVELFEDMADQWRTFLDEEGLFEFRPEQPEDE